MSTAGNFDADIQPSDAVPAGWFSRLGAATVDVLPGAAVVSTAALAALALPSRDSWWWVCAGVGVAAIVWTAANRLILPVVWGYSVGRAVFGVRIATRDSTDIGPWRLVAREIAHLLDVLTVVGWLWPAWSPRRGTFADMATRTQACRPMDHADGQPRRIGAALVATAALLCAALAGISYTAVGQYDSAVRDAQLQVSADGPRMVEQLLSYQPETVDDDFDRARAVASETYRDQLIAQQQAIQAAAPVRNQYWVVRSAVVAAEPDAVTMLMFLEGERGTLPDLRYLTASVRASFVNGGDGGWRVDRLDVITSPQTGGSQS
ncbi:RDD family protein [Mycolicibacterium hippocampi]|uniref:RDD family protein n=1 Tax=Mycolicibacterium hippocampi TaxID=659824 RepID=A0A7I9ZML7_9MYCO|nr:RDD family protein [Mycolicibacterium hippocampi]GFH02079.1 RDD family protein [Mycolicibacterium hippocampi]